MFRRAFSAAAVFGFGWGGAGQKEQFTISNEAKIPNIAVIRPEVAKENDVLLSRKIVNELDRTKLNIRLYQYETCPFCCKVRAYLDYHGFSYEIVEVNPVTRSQIKFSKEYKKVPIVRVGEELSLTESSLVISQLATLLVNPDRSLKEIMSMYPTVESTDDKGKPAISHPNKYFVMTERSGSVAEMAASKEEREWREWVDSHFIHLISPNVYRTFPESLETFRWFQVVGDWHRTFPSWERCLAVYMGATAMWALSKRLKKRHNIDDERAAMKEACDKWMQAIGPNRKFMGGDRPNLADLALYGAMQSFYGCAAFKECCSTGPISEWYARMKSAVERREGAYLLTATKFTSTMDVSMDEFVSGCVAAYKAGLSTAVQAAASLTLNRGHPMMPPPPQQQQQLMGVAPLNNLGFAGQFGAGNNGIGAGPIPIFNINSSNNGGFGGYVDQQRFGGPVATTTGGGMVPVASFNNNTGGGIDETARMPVTTPSLSSLLAAPTPYMIPNDQSMVARRAARVPAASTSSLQQPAQRPQYSYQATPARSVQQPQPQQQQQLLQTPTAPLPTASRAVSVKDSAWNLGSSIPTSSSMVASTLTGYVAPTQAAAPSSSTMSVAHPSSPWQPQNSALLGVPKRATNAHLMPSNVSNRAAAAAASAAAAPTPAAAAATPTDNEKVGLAFSQANYVSRPSGDKDAVYFEFPGKQGTVVVNVTQSMRRFTTEKKSSLVTIREMVKCIMDNVYRNKDASLKVTTAGPRNPYKGYQGLREESLRDLAKFWRANFECTQTHPLCEIKECFANQIKTWLTANRSRVKNAPKM